MLDGAGSCCQPIDDSCPSRGTRSLATGRSQMSVGFLDLGVRVVVKTVDFLSYHREVGFGRIQRAGLP